MANQFSKGTFLNKVLLSYIILSMTGDKKIQDQSNFLGPSISPQYILSSSLLKETIIHQCTLNLFPTTEQRRRIGNTFCPSVNPGARKVHVEKCVAMSKSRYLPSKYLLREYVVSEYVQAFFLNYEAWKFLTWKNLCNLTLCRVNSNGCLINTLTLIKHVSRLSKR